jgi:hypothetical protein
MTEPKYTPEFLKDVKTLLDTPIENHKEIIEHWKNLYEHRPTRMLRQAWEELGVRVHVSDSILNHKPTEEPKNGYGLELERAARLRKENE